MRNVVRVVRIRCAKLGDQQHAVPKSDRRACGRFATIYSAFSRLVEQNNILKKQSAWRGSRRLPNDDHALQPQPTIDPQGWELWHEVVLAESARFMGPGERDLSAVNRELVRDRDVHSRRIQQPSHLQQLHNFVDEYERAKQCAGGAGRRPPLKPNTHRNDDAPQPHRTVSIKFLVLEDGGTQGRLLARVARSVLPGSMEEIRYVAIGFVDVLRTR